MSEGLPLMYDRKPWLKFYGEVPASGRLPLRYWSKKK